MKLSGVDGVLINWYGVEGTNGDVASLLNNSNALIDRVDDFGLQFGVVMEDRFSASIGQAQANVAYLRDNYFNNSQYIRLGADQNPLLGVFGPITFEQESQWTEILDPGGEPVEPVDFLTLWYESADAGANADGEYAWIYEDEVSDNHLAHQSNFYRFRAPALEMAGGVAYPGFNDYYQEGGIGNIVAFEIPHGNGQTLDAVLGLAELYPANIDFLQLATFNDFGEGTMFEPTVETGYEYLKQIQQYTGVSYSEADLQLVYRLYLARKEYAGNTAIHANLDQVSELLASLDIAGATSLLNSTAPAGDYDGDADTDANDYLTWRSRFGSSTILYGSGADGNFDGKVDAADYLVWRDGFAGGAGLTAHAVPEPTAAALAKLAALALSCCLANRRKVRR
jgi:hypothetical protein